MARGRMLNKTVCASLKFQELPDDTCRLLATWIIAHLDCHGVFYADPAMVKSYVLPRRSDIDAEQVGEYLDAIEAVGLMERFQDKGDIWQYWPGFTDNQAGLRANRETTDYPNPPDYGGDDAGCLPDACRNDAGNVPDTIPPKGKERNRKEGKGSPPPQQFDFIAEAFTAYKNEIGQIASATQADDIQSYLSELDELGLQGWWRLALDRALDANARRWDYIRAILRSCIDKGIPPGANGKRGRKTDPPESQPQVVSIYEPGDERAVTL